MRAVTAARAAGVAGEVRVASFKVPDGWVAQAYRFALDPGPAQQRALAAHAGAARFAFNHMLAHVAEVTSQRAAERSYGIPDDQLTPTQGWSLPALRREWNRRKDTVAPWWPECSKEAYNSGLDSLARALRNWCDSRDGRRAGPRVRFPRFRSRHTGKVSCRFTTGVIRVEPDRHHITLPRLGTIRTHESTRKLARRLEAGIARILSATVRRRGARWFCSFQVIVAAKARPAHAPQSVFPVAGVDVGVVDLLVVAAPDGTQIARIPAPRPLRAAQGRLARLQRQAARRHGPYDPRTDARRVPSRRWRATQARIARLHTHAASIRRDVLHKATATLACQHQVIVVETLNVAGMLRAGGARKRGLNRALADASLAEIRHVLAYKTAWYGSTMVGADRWYPSSKTCSACGTVKTKLSLAERTYRCESCGAVLDRDLNAAVNLARHGEAVLAESWPAGSGPAAGRGATGKTRAPSDARAEGCEASTPHGAIAAGRTGTAPPQGEAA